MVKVYEVLLSLATVGVIRPPFSEMQASALSDQLERALPEYTQPKTEPGAEIILGEKLYVRARL